MRVPLLHLLLACMCMCVRVYVCCTIQTIIYDTRRIEKREENEKEWRERFDDELREKNASTILCRFFHGRNGDKDPLLFYSLYLSRSTLLDLFSSRRRVYGKIVSKQCFFETLFASRRVAFHFRIVTGRGLADIIKFVRCVHARSRAGEGEYDTR